MSKKTSQNDAALPIEATLEPTDSAQVGGMVRDAFAEDYALYPIGGATSLDYGLPARRGGFGLSLAKLNRVIDYPARDMTVTVDAGITISELSKTLVAERQQLAIDVPQADRATIGGVVATNFNGHRRFGHGAIRDHVIGITAVDGRGVTFKGGGRVVKNVAGYDFCKLLTGSMGTLGVITQLTLKLKPIPDAKTWCVTRVPDTATADRVLASITESVTSPTSLELLGGAVWDEQTELKEVGGPASNGAKGGFWIAACLEGTASEVAWMGDKLVAEWKRVAPVQPELLADAPKLVSVLAEFPQHGDAALTIRASLVPSGITKFIGASREIDPECSIQSHAGNGIVIVRFPTLPAAGLARTLIGKLHAVASSSFGHVTMLANPSQQEVTHRSVWGGTDLPIDLMQAVKKQFDPKDILNPGRFVYL